MAGKTFVDSLLSLESPEPVCMYSQPKTTDSLHLSCNEKHLLYTYKIRIEKGIVMEVTQNLHSAAIFSPFQDARGGFCDAITKNLKSCRPYFSIIEVFLLSWPLSLKNDKFYFSNVDFPSPLFLKRGRAGRRLTSLLKKFFSIHTKVILRPCQNSGAVGWVVLKQSRKVWECEQGLTLLQDIAVQKQKCAQKLIWRYQTVASFWTSCP